MSVLGAVSLAGDMDAVGFAVGSLFDELVEVAVVHDPGEPTVENLHAGVVSTIRSHEVILQRGC